MKRHVNAIAGRLSLRPPQRDSLEILHRIWEIAPPRNGADPAAVLEAIRGEYPSVTDFEWEFPSLCFALATGLGKTRLVGAFISYLYLAHGIGNFEETDSKSGAGGSQEGIEWPPARVGRGGGAIPSAAKRSRRSRMGPTDS